KYTSLNYQGVQFASAIDASQMQKLHIDIWTPNCTAFDVYPIVSGQPEQFVTLNPTLSGWNSFDIDLSKYTIPLNAIIQFKFVGTPFGSSTVYFDNLYFYKSGTGGGEPTTAAPTPTRNANGVISLFSNAYSNVTVDTWSAVWDAADLADVQIEGNDTKLYTNLNYAGVEFTSKTIDATTMDNFHVDIWTPNSTTFHVKLVDFGADNSYGGGDDTESELTFTPALSTWVGYDIKLSDFTGLAARAHLAQLLFIGSNSTVYVDNVYFYNSLLPIKLTDFKVSRVNNTALINWTTAFESNNKGFAIERSADAVKWQQINFINASAAAGSGLRNYSATDMAPVKGVNYYRIKQVDYDGAISYSFIKSINFDDIATTNMAIFPNPAKDRFTITFGTIQSNDARYFIIGLDGKVVKSAAIDKSFSNSVKTIDVSGLPRGAYIVKLVDGSKQQTAKLILN
ncbi:MAG TPA: T9SS type A sorting domain-containing protein, partial [Chitinophagaceae bacterium]|nr:T9SS type A sorting domain-containing protein [Chitinophagaceae bacterium]